MRDFENDFFQEIVKYNDHMRHAEHEDALDVLLVIIKKIYEGQPHPKESAL